MIGFSTGPPAAASHAGSGEAFAAEAALAGVAIAQPPVTSTPSACRRLKGIGSIAGSPGLCTFRELPTVVRGQRLPVCLSGGPKAPEPGGVAPEDLLPVRGAEERDL